jgi:hypothetical protein
MTNKIDKQRLDAYVQAVLANTAGGISTLNDSTISWGCKQCYTLAKAMMDYVDSQVQEQEDNSWTKNTAGLIPVAGDTEVDLIFSDGETKLKVPAGWYTWELDPTYDDDYYITEWRLAQ